jgi:hypothetical protein
VGQADRLDQPVSLPHHFAHYHNGGTAHFHLSLGHGSEVGLDHALIRQ